MNDDARDSVSITNQAPDVGSSADVHTGGMWLALTSLAFSIVVLAGAIAAWFVDADTAFGISTESAGAVDRLRIFASELGAIAPAAPILAIVSLLAEGPAARAWSYRSVVIWTVAIVLISLNTQRLLP